jgi:hypothetical protein
VEVRHGRSVHAGRHDRFLPVNDLFDRTLRLANPAALTASRPPKLQRIIFHTHTWRCCMDLIYLAGISLFSMLAIGLAVGCAKLGGIP